MSGGARAVFLDRDGVLNHLVERDGQPVSPRHGAEFRLFAEAPDAVRRLRAAGWLVCVVTNQPDLARGMLERTELDAMHAELVTALHPDEVAICPHDDADGCGCRKPAPGLLIEVARRRGIDLGRSFMVGDSWRDVEAARRAGCRSVGIDRGGSASLAADHVVRTLAEAALYIAAVSNHQP